MLPVDPNTAMFFPGRIMRKPEQATVDWGQQRVLEGGIVWEAVGCGNMVVVYNIRPCHRAQLADSIQFLPQRINPHSVRIEEGGDLKPVIAGRFLLVPNPGRCDPQRSSRVVFRALPERT